jgi:hypothetical protein
VRSIRGVPSNWPCRKFACRLLQGHGPRGVPDQGRAARKGSSAGGYDEGSDANERRCATWHGPPEWFHGDVAAGNLLVEGDRLSAVIDLHRIIGGKRCLLGRLQNIATRRFSTFTFPRSRQKSLRRSSRPTSVIQQTADKGASKMRRSKLT